jgi:hypothetical protein
MPSRHFVPLTGPQCEQLDAALAEGDAAGASAVLTMFGGDQRKAECALWGTWEGLCGGEPFNRPKERVDSDEARMLMRLVTIISEGLESPKVERTGRSLFVAA